MYVSFSRMFILGFSMLVLTCCTEVETPVFLEAPAITAPDLPPTELRPELRPGPIDNPLLETFGITAIHSIQKSAGGWLVVFQVSDAFHDRFDWDHTNTIRVQIREEMLAVEGLVDAQLCLTSGQITSSNENVLQELGDGSVQEVAQLLELIFLHLVDSEQSSRFGYIPIDQAV
ncbi:hypothetical protein A3SI_10664 [Nitritalea halalkaliphila LW7]|uniref:Lipoprotein n=1 Tax=Nitritalea halalkaliphila LW7 TaxID=1189621 RepID=I5C372_9BACT|nr:hypothetical protein [Nitritalea halalkaliphila]EIM76274.1 hypothetical protein A3SI_10664 [Nitritalea halalkaliphila LW7]